MPGSSVTAGQLAALHREREAALAEAAALTDTMGALRAMRVASPDDDEHDPEGPTLSSEWSRIRGLLLAAEARLSEVDAASARVHEGRYGLCLACGRPIAPQRLEARPTAAYCIDCAARR